MNHNETITSQGSAQCCRDYCDNNVATNNEEITNRYKCNQKPFTISDLWNIQKERKQPGRRYNF